MRKRHLLIYGATVATVFAGLTIARPAVTPQTKVVSARIGPADIYPPSWAVGAIDDETSGNVQGTICNPQWSTKAIRPPVGYTSPLKVAQLKQLGYADQTTADYEEDHLISLELGGSPTLTANLWPEPYNVSIPDGGAKFKDRVENFLHAQVCAGKISLEEAQKDIVSDWYKILKDNNL